MSEMWELGLHPGQAEVHEPIIMDDELWAHEMSDEPEQPDTDDDEMERYLWLHPDL